MSQNIGINQGQFSVFKPIKVYNEPKVGFMMLLDVAMCFRDTV